MRDTRNQTHADVNECARKRKPQYTFCRYCSLALHCDVLRADVVIYCLLDCNLLVIASPGDKVASYLVTTLQFNTLPKSMF